MLLSDLRIGPVGGRRCAKRLLEIRELERRWLTVSILWTDDKMLGLNEEACCNARSLPLNSFVQDLVRALSAKRLASGFEKIARDGSLFEGRMRIAPQAIALGTS
jgi:hypothetical protein